AEAGEHLQRAVATAEETGDLSLVYISLGFLGHWHGQRQELAQANECLDRALTIAAELEALLYVSMLEAFRAETEIKEGLFEKALTRATRAAQMAKETRQQGCEAQAHRVLGWALYYGQPDSRDGAEAAFREAVAIQERIGERISLARTLYELSDFLQGIGKTSASNKPRAAADALKQELSLQWLPMPSPTPALAT
ncbi:MAG: hypothetical protein ACRET4_02970, partial [Steroidobacteraceae bacterium]